MAAKNRLSENGVTRREFDALVRTVEDCARSLDLQFKRIAQIQAELDHIQAAWAGGKGKSRWS